ncbi:MAG: PadR family transcriptional regulator [Chloroflexi bacterium]|nr:PadR family transcriptional regulator [Chloroflexota bacterium]
MTDAELAILSIVAEGPIYGYDIQTLVVQRGLRAWTNIGISSMYYVLEKLERQGLVEGKGQEAEGSARRQYRVTSAGFGVLQTAVADLISTPREYANGFELGLVNMHVLRSSQIRTAFIAYRQELVSRLAQARERWRKLKEDKAPFSVDAMMSHHIAMLEAELDWIKVFIEQWEAQAPPDEPAAYSEPVDIPRMKQVVLPHDPDSPHRVPTRPLPQPSSYPPAPPAPASSKQTSFSTKTPPRLADSLNPPASEDVTQPLESADEIDPPDKGGE